MRLKLIYAILFTSSNLFAQTYYPIKVEILDSLIYETRKGRACNDLQQAQASEIKALGIELVANGKVIKLQASENSTLQFLYNSLQQEMVLTIQAHTQEKWSLKSLIKKLWLAVSIEALLIVLILI